MINDKQQAAVEYLVEQLFPKALSAEQYYHIEKAKEMQKERIMDAFQYGKWDWHEHITNGIESKDPSQYYNETYGGNNEQ